MLIDLEFGFSEDLGDEMHATEVVVTEQRNIMVEFLSFLTEFSRFFFCIYIFSL